MFLIKFFKLTKIFSQDMNLDHHAIKNKWVDGLSSSNLDIDSLEKKLGWVFIVTLNKYVGLDDLYK